MSLIPAFEIGLWNAWIFMVAFLFFHSAAWVAWLILGYDLKGVFRKAGASDPHNKTKKKIDIFSMLTLLLIFLYSIFLPLQIGTAWFYIGLPICLLGFIAYEIAWVAWANTPPHDPVTRGLYRYSRHPVYIAIFLQLIGVGIVTASWVFLLLTVVFIVFAHFLVIAEERFCLETYGDTYRQYMNRTSRWIGIPKSGAIS